jgi:tungstate transport system substrate-binding protein
MRAEAVPAGEQLIAQEAHLDALFAHRQVTPASLAEATAAIGATQATLRATHLKYHLSTAKVLTESRSPATARCAGTAATFKETAATSAGAERMLRRTLLALAVLAPLAVAGQERVITLASTTSTEESGLLAHIVPLFRCETGIDVRVVAVGSGQALSLAARGDADAVLVHDRVGEERFVAEGHGLDRREVMANDFVLIGPKVDPAGVRGAGEIVEAFRRIAIARAPFASRGDDSGTHRMELRLWRAAGLGRPAGAWYLEVGQGMGPTLNIAAGLNGYTLADRATWANFKNRHELEVLGEGDAVLLNPYSSILVNPAKGRHIKAAEARIWHEWLRSDAGRSAISSYRIADKQLFFLPDANGRLTVQHGSGPTSRR